MLRALAVRIPARAAAIRALSALGPRIGAVRRLAAVGALAAALALPGCVCCAARGDYARAGLETPERALRSFCLYFAAGLHDLEYRCFSAEFTRRNGLSLLGYGEARAELARSKPWLEWLAGRSFEIVGSRARSAAQHELDLEVGGRTLRVRMVREDFYRIWAGDELVDDGRAPFEEWVGVAEGPDGRPVVSAQVALATQSIDPKTLTRVTFERVWKLDDLWEIEPEELEP